MKPEITQTNLPERVEFILIDGNKIAVIHCGNRLEITIPNGQPLIVHPKSGNTISAMVGDSFELSMPFDPEELEKE